MIAFLAGATREREREENNKEKGELAEMNKNRVLVEGVLFITCHAGFV